MAAVFATGMAPAFAAWLRQRRGGGSGGRRGGGLGGRLRRSLLRSGLLHGRLGGHFRRSFLHGRLGGRLRSGLLREHRWSTSPQPSSQRSSSRQARWSTSPQPSSQRSSSRQARRSTSPQPSSQRSSSRQAGRSTSPQPSSRQAWRPTSPRPSSRQAWRSTSPRPSSPGLQPSSRRPAAHLQLAGGSTRQWRASRSFFLGRVSAASASALSDAVISRSRPPDPRVSSPIRGPCSGAFAVAGPRRLHRAPSLDQGAQAGPSLVCASVRPHGQAPSTAVAVTTARF